MAKPTTQEISTVFRAVSNGYEEEPALNASIFTMDLRQLQAH